MGKRKDSCLIEGFEEGRLSLAFWRCKDWEWSERFWLGEELNMRGSPEEVDRLFEKLVKPFFNVAAMR